MRNIITLLLTVCTVVKSKVKISQNFVAFSEHIKVYVVLLLFSFWPKIAIFEKISHESEGVDKM